ncbi:RluA family pseudouridine synthase [Jiella endophytica]|uniref:Pseudouridine synthase n=1 Tax=Jiella endophytica TaxID=2558362 RepID=A0A4Y8RDJ3_9HYPH|nr:RluA family pseudouridine synthase [Jiella endophytica]TFF19671.1 RluA family pseudouridine synthase [Jiella endophytica]
METRRFVVAEPDAGERLDVFLARLLDGELSRSRIKALIEDGNTRIDDRPAESAKRKLAAGESVELALPAPEDAEPKPQQIPLDIRYEDAFLLVIDKPAGLVVHPGAGNPDGTLVNALVAHCGPSLTGIGGVRRPGIVHRLDKDTSGLLVVAKTETAHRSLSEQFAAHGRDGRLSRTYLAVVWGEPRPAAGVVDAALGRSATNRIKRAVVPAGRSDARHAMTHYETLAVGHAAAEASLLRCRLETGRTHQIRVHMAHIGHPLVADPLYGAAMRTKAVRLDCESRAVVDDFGRQALHAAELGFRHPADDRTMLFRSPLPADMRNLCEVLSVDVADEAIVRLDGEPA